MGIGVEGDKKNSKGEETDMTDKMICPEDQQLCIMTEEEKGGQGCFNCPKVQDVLRKMKEVDEGGEEQTQ